MYTLEQQKEHRKLWVEALRSGKYRQGEGALRSEDKFCCLGVLADIAGCIWFGDDNNGWTANGDDTIAPDSAVAFVGLKDCGGVFAERNVDGTPKALWRLNDSGVSFTEIADIIEREPIGLFVNGAAP